MMICKNCGWECADDMFFCTKCGGELSKDEQEEVIETVDTVVESHEEVVTEVVDETVTEVAEKSEQKIALTKGKKTVALGLALVAILVLILIPAIAKNYGNDSFMRISEQSIFNIEERDGDWYVFYTNGESLKLDDEPVKILKYSMDESMVCYTNTKGNLVIVKDGKQIKTNIKEPQSLVLSQQGNMLAYFIDCEYVTYEIDYVFSSQYVHKNMGTLYLYDTTEMTSIEIAERVEVGSAVFSPNGKTVAYAAEYEESEMITGYYYVIGEKPKEVGWKQRSRTDGWEKRVFAISDNGKYIYYTKSGDIYVAKNNKKEEKLVKNFYNAEIMMNTDNTEILFSSDIVDDRFSEDFVQNDDATYISVNGSEKKSVSVDRLNSMIWDTDVAYCYQEYLNMGKFGEPGSINVLYTGVDTFREKLFYSNEEDDIYYLNKKYETALLATNVKDYAVANDGRSLIVNNDEDIIRVTAFDKGGEYELIATEAKGDRVFAGGELEHIYVISDDILYYEKNGNRKKIVDDVTEAMISYDGEYCYYIVENEEFCYSKKGGKGKRLLLADEGGMACSNEGGMALLATYEDGVSTMYKMEGSKMTVIYELEED